MHGNSRSVEAWAEARSLRDVALGDIRRRSRHLSCFFDFEQNPNSTCFDLLWICLASSKRQVEGMEPELKMMNKN